MQFPDENDNPNGVSFDGNNSREIKELLESQYQFMKAFRKLENEFMEWKSLNETHPDKASYYNFLAQWDGIKKELKEKQSLRLKKLNKLLSCYQKKKLEASLPILQNNTYRSNEENFDENWSIPAPTNFAGATQPIDGILADAPSFTPATVVDYQKLFEFKVSRVIEYNHKSTPELKAFIKYVDLDRAARIAHVEMANKRNQNYMKRIISLDETVSTANYPNNWEKIPQARGSSRNTRKKALTKKVLKASGKFKELWMTKGLTKGYIEPQEQEIASHHEEVLLVSPEPVMESQPVSILQLIPLHSVSSLRSILNDPTGNEDNIEWFLENLDQDVRDMLWVYIENYTDNCNF